MDRWRALVALNVAGRRVEPGEVFDGYVEHMADAVRLRLAEPAAPRRDSPSAKPRARHRPRPKPRQPR